MAEMQLEDFVTETLTQVVRAVNKAHGQVVFEGGEIAPDAPSKQNSTKVEFDIAVTTSESKGKQGQFGIKVASIQGNSGSSQMETSRIKFALSLRLPNLSGEN